VLPAVLPPQLSKFQVPEFPASPPIGTCLFAGRGELRSQLILPADTLQAIGRYVHTIQGMAGAKQPETKP
jgi:hypothetical protein